MVPACVAGLTAAIALVVFWHRLALAAGYRGYFAMLIGAAVAYAMALVGRAFRGPRLQVASLSLTVAAIGIGNYVVVNALVHQFAQRHAQEVPRFIGAGMFWHAFDQLTYGRDFLYLAVGLALAALVPHRKARRDLKT